MKPRDIYDPLGMKTAEFISRMRQQFPKYSKAANSMANHPEQNRHLPHQCRPARF